LAPPTTSRPPTRPCKVRSIRRGCNATSTALPATSARCCAARSSSALKHHEKLDPAGDDQIEGLSGAMTDVDNHEQVSPNELLAADYALGVLAGTERTAARTASRAIVLLPPWLRRGKNGLRPGQRNSRESPHRRRFGNGSRRGSPAHSGSVQDFGRASCSGPADRPGHRQRQAHKYVSTIMHPQLSSLRSCQRLPRDSHTVMRDRSEL